MDESPDLGDFDEAAADFDDADDGLDDDGLDDDPDDDLDDEDSLDEDDDFVTDFSPVAFFLGCSTLSEPSLFTGFLALTAGIGPIKQSANESPELV